MSNQGCDMCCGRGVWRLEIGAWPKVCPRKHRRWTLVKSQARQLSAETRGELSQVLIIIISKHLALSPHSTLSHLMRPSSPPPTLLSAPLRRPCQRPRRASPSTAAPHPHPDLSRPSLFPVRSLPIARLRTVDTSQGEGVQLALHP
jgi:hypothetical protein